METSTDTPRELSARSFWQEARMRQMGFMVNLLIALSSAIIAITPGIIGATDDIGALIETMEPMVLWAAASVSAGVLASAIRLVDFRFSYWKLLSQRRNWRFQWIVVDKTKAEWWSNIFGRATWGILIVQALFWLAASYYLVRTLLAMLYLASGEPSEASESVIVGWN